MPIFKRLVYALLFALLLSSVAFGQDFDDFKKQVNEDYDKFEKSTQQSFNNFVEKVDKEFTAYLVESFGPYATEQFGQPANNPKPNTIPKADNDSQPAEMIKYIEVKQDFSIRQGPILPNITKSEAIIFETDSVSVEFLAWPLYFISDKQLKNTQIKTIDASGISGYWNKLSAANYNHLLYQLSNVKNILNLNDWGYYQLVRSYTQQLLPNDKNKQVLLQWVLLSRSRYKVKVAFADENLYLLVPTMYTVYNTDFIRFNGLEYYVMDGSANDLQTYPDDFPEADMIMDLRISKPFYTNVLTTTIRTFNFTYEGQALSVKMKIDPNMIDFYNTIPLTDIRVYFNSVISEMTKESIIEAFTPLIEGKSQLDAADLLLKFVQQAFRYKTDQQAFGNERYFYPDELLYHPYSDCEDRSVLYSYLVKTMLKTNVVGLGYPGHMATAVHFEEKPEGYFLTYNSKDYVIADPTFLDASIGMLMPMARDQKAELILTDSKFEEINLSASLWEKVRHAGGSKADLLNDVVFDENGNAYICGYFTRKVELDDFSIQSDYKGRDVFVAKFDNKFRPIWINKASGPGNDLAFSLALSKDGNLYLYGSVEGELDFGRTTIEASGAPDVFVAMYNADGQLKWVQKAGIDKLDHTANFMFAARFNPEGKKIMAKLYSEAENFEHYGLSLDQNSNALITGSFFATPGMNSNDFINYDGLETNDKPKALKEKNDEFIQLNYEKTIAGLFAALNLIKYNNYELKGGDVQQVFDKYNNQFINASGEFYKNFGEMTFLKNKGGIIIIKTKTGNPLYFNMIKVEDEARIKIIKYKSGNVAVQIFSGILVGSSKKWLAMNSIKLFKENGDILFDYDDDHSTKKLNLKKEILKH